jgi:putative membrane protein
MASKLSMEVKQMRDRFFIPNQAPRHDGWADAFHALSTIAFVALLILLVIAVVQWLRRGPHTLTPAVAAPAPTPRPATDQALSEARLRYARGELTREQFLQISMDLGGDVVYTPAPPAPPPQPPATPE